MPYDRANREWRNGLPFLSAEDLQEAGEQKLFVDGDSADLTLLLPGARQRLRMLDRYTAMPTLEDFGGRANDFAYDNGPAFLAASNWGKTRGGIRCALGAGIYHMDSGAGIDGWAAFDGIGWSETPGAGLGTALHISDPGFAPFVLRGPNTRGGGFRNMAVIQDHPVPGPGWAPVDYPPVFVVVDAFGELQFDNLFFAGVTRGILCTNSGRLTIGRMRGHFFKNAVRIDRAYDTCKIDDLHAWPYFAPGSDPVNDYCIDNCDVVHCERVDGIEIGRLFSIFTRSSLRIGGSQAVGASPGGTVQRASVNDLYCDGAKYGLWVDETAQGASLHINSIRNGGERLNASGPQTTAAQVIPGASAIRVDGWTLLQVASAHLYYNDGPQIELTNPNAPSTLHFGSCLFNAYSITGTGEPAIHAVQCVSPHNIYFGTEPVRLGVGPLVNSGDSNVKVRTPEPQYWLVPLSGSATIGINNSYPYLLLQPTGPIGNLTVLMPQHPEDGHTVCVSTTGPISAVAFTLYANAGQNAVLGAPASLAAGASAHFKFAAGPGLWIRV